MHIPYCYYCYFMEAGEVSGGLIRALHGRPLINLYIISYLPPHPPSFHDYYYDYYHYHHYHYHYIIYYYYHYIIHYYYYHYHYYHFYYHHYITIILLIIIVWISCSNSCHGFPQGFGSLCVGDSRLATEKVIRALMRASLGHGQRGQCHGENMVSSWTFIIVCMGFVWKLWDFYRICMEIMGFL
jgi:hypothetical protein